MSQLQDINDSQFSSSLSTVNVNNNNNDLLKNNELVQSVPVFINQNVDPFNENSLQDSYRRNSNLYFREDTNLSSQQMTTLADENEREAKDIELNDPPKTIVFYWDQFFTALFYHLMFAIFGPFLYPLAKLLDKKNVGLIKNMGFWFPHIYMELMFFIIQWSFVFLIIYDQTGGKGRIIFTHMTVFTYYEILRTLVICCKYGVIHPEKFRVYQKKFLTDKQLQKEYAIRRWLPQSIEVIQEELENSIYRQEIETSSFYMNFIEQPSQKLLNPIQNKKAPLGRINEYLNISVNFREFAYGPYMAREIIKSSNKIFTSRILSWAFFIALLRMILIVTFSVIFPQKFDENDANVHKYMSSWSGIYVFTMSQVSQFFLVLQMLVFCLMINRELDRKLFFMDQLGYLIAAQKVELYEYNKLYPPLNLAYDLSIRSWFKLRSILQEFGYKYMKRFELMISFLLLAKLMFAIVIGLSYFNVISFFSHRSINIKVSTFEIAVGTGFLLYMIKKGVQINSYASEHKFLILKNMVIMDNISTQYSFLQNEQYKSTTDNYMYKGLLTHFDYLGKQRSSEEIIQYIKRIVNTLQGCIEQLDYEEKFSPFKLLGFNVNKEMLIKILVALGSVLGAIIYNIFLRNN